MNVETTQLQQVNTTSGSGYEPTAEQLARRRARRNFNWLYVYSPLLGAGLLLLVAVVSMIWLTVAGAWFVDDLDTARYRVIVSGMADFLTIIMMVPLLLLCALPTVTVVGLGIYRRRRRDQDTSVAEAAPKLLTLLWRVETLVDSVRMRVGSITPRFAQPIVTAHKIGAYALTLLAELKQIIAREIRRNASR